MKIHVSLQQKIKYVVFINAWPLERFLCFRSICFRLKFIGSARYRLMMYCATTRISSKGEMKLLSSININLAKFTYQRSLKKHARFYLRGISLIAKSNLRENNHSLRMGGRASDPPMKARQECLECNEGVANVNGTRVTGTSIREMSLVDMFGARRVVSEVSGEDGKAVVVFLRHLG